MSEDYWGLLPPAPLTTPKSILLEQAALLGQKTNNKIVAKVEFAKDEDEDFVNLFVLVVPALGNYRLCLFEIAYSIKLYPLRWTTYHGYGAPHKGHIVIEDEGTLRSRLKTYLSDKSTHHILSALMSQAMERLPPPAAPTPMGGATQPLL